MTRPAYVMHDERRWYVAAATEVDGTPGYVLRRSDPRTREVIEIIARKTECEEWRRPDPRRTIKGSLRHRGSTVVMEVQRKNETTLISLRLKGRHHRYNATLEGMFDLLARADVERKKREREWDKRTRKRKRG